MTAHASLLMECLQRLGVQVKLNKGLDFVNLDDILVDLKLTPDVLEIPVPKYYTEDRAKVRNVYQIWLMFCGATASIPAPHQFQHQSTSQRTGSCCVRGATAPLSVQVQQRYQVSSTHTQVILTCVWKGIKHVWLAAALACA